MKTECEGTTVGIRLRNMNIHYYLLSHSLRHLAEGSKSVLTFLCKATLLKSLNTTLSRSSPSFRLFLKMLQPILSSEAKEFTMANENLMLLSC